MKVSFAAVLLAACTLTSPAQARTSQWWYVAQGADRVLFIDEKSIERDGNIASYASRQILREPGNEVASQQAHMRTDCVNRTQQWVIVRRYARDERVVDPGSSYDELEPVETGTIGEAELDFVCADNTADRASTGGFPLEIDDVAFAEALIAADDTSPADLHATMKADPATPVIRSSAPAPATFGTEQRVATGQPIVPPRDYEKGVDLPDTAQYDADETGRIYDLAYQGIEAGEIVFEIRGYEPTDLVHAGSGQNIRVPVEAGSEQIRDLLVTIIEATPDALRYRVERKLGDDVVMPGEGE